MSNGLPLTDPLFKMVPLDFRQEAGEIGFVTPQMAVSESLLVHCYNGLLYSMRI